MWDNPFSCGEIGENKFRYFIPSSFPVEAITGLTLKNPAASGYLKFNKENFIQEVRKEIEGKFDE